MLVASGPFAVGSGGEALRSLVNRDSAIAARFGPQRVPFRAFRDTAQPKSAPQPDAAC